MESISVIRKKAKNKKQKVMNQFAISWFIASYMSFTVLMIDKQIWF